MMAPRPSLLPVRALLLLGLAAAACVCAQDKPDAVTTSEADINQLTDDILAGIATYAKKQDITAINLPDVEQHFSTTVAWILSITGSIQLTGGSLTKFADVRRHDSSHLTFITRPTDAGELVLSTGIELPDIEASYDFVAKAGVVTQRGRIDVTVSGLKASTMVDMDMNALTLGMADLKVDDMGNIKVQVKDGVVGWLASAISNLVVSTIKTNVRKAIETKLPPIINELLAKLDIADMIKPHLKATL